MTDDAIVFALSNPDPEIWPEEIPDNVRIMATGRTDYPNQINNSLCFPGLFRGVLDVRAREINDEMKVAAATAIASVIPERHLSEDFIIPSVFDRSVARNVARDVAKAAAGFRRGSAQVASGQPGLRSIPDQVKFGRKFRRNCDWRRRGRMLRRVLPRT